MKKFLMLIMAIAFSVNASEINDYKYYANNNSFFAYIKNDDNCIYGGPVSERIPNQYCEMGSSGFNLKTEFPSVYATELLLSSGANLSFVIAAPWSEQKCKINLHKKILTCEPTGN